MSEENSYVCVGSFGGSPEDPDWIANLQKDSEGVLEICGKNILVTGEFVKGLKRNILWGKLVNFYPGFGYYQSVTSRCIPVVKFSPKI
jgi:deazaflavin-dependent oxidoreductase (nitroreductase family)